MAKNFRELKAKMSPGARARSDAKTQKMIEEMALNELRRAMGITQERLAKALRINQARVSKIESRSDIFVSTLRKTLSRRWAASWRFTRSLRLVKCGLGSLVGLRESAFAIPGRRRWPPRESCCVTRSDGRQRPTIDVDVGIEYLLREK